MKVLCATIVLLGLTVPVAALDSIFEIAQENDFDTLVTALEIANLDNFLDCNDSSCPIYTAFAPTNQAFAALPKALLTQLTTDKEYREHLKQLLRYHLIYGRVYSNTITNGERFRTRQGGRVTATKSGEIITINGNARVVLADVKASNGLVHAIDKVLVPSFLKHDLVQVAVANSNFKTLVAAVSAVNGLVDVLKGGPFTIFAPTDTAFAKLGKATLNTLLADPNGQLASILKYHVVPGIVTKNELKDGHIKTVQGATISVDVCSSSTKINGLSTVTDTNILGSNGVIHVIVSVVFSCAYLGFPSSKAVR